MELPESTSHGVVIQPCVSLSFRVPLRGTGVRLIQQDPCACGYSPEDRQDWVKVVNVTLYCFILVPTRVVTSAPPSAMVTPATTTRQETFT